VDADPGRRRASRRRSGRRPGTLLIA
jgi:hypothetical protein